MKTIRHITLALTLTLAFFALPSMSNSAMNNYCITPPFIVQNIQPNIMIVLDNSLSLEGPAYAENDYDPTQFANGQYYGYFDATKNYKYTTYATPTAASPNRWIPTTEPMTNGTATNPIASGNFLNWATMRRVDVAKKLLIGGRAATGITTPGAYNVAHRTTNPVKLYGNPNNTYVSNFDHDYNNVIPYTIYPFTGDYNFEMDETFLNVTPNDTGASSEIVRPTSNVSVAAWTVFPSSTSAWADVDDTGTGDGDTTYIRNSTSTTAAIVANTGYAPTIPPATPGVGFISSVIITIRAIKAGGSTSNTRNITGLIRVKNLAGVDTDYLSSIEQPSRYYLHKLYLHLGDKSCHRSCVDI